MNAGPWIEGDIVGFVDIRARSTFTSGLEYLLLLFMTLQINHVTKKCA